MREYERLVEALEDLADLRAADETLEVIARGEEDLLPLDEAVQEMEEERSRLREAGELPGKKAPLCQAAGRFAAGRSARSCL